MGEIKFTMGELTEGVYPLEFTIVTEKTWYNCLRFWLFFKFFPFEFRGWVDAK